MLRTRRNRLILMSILVVAGIGLIAYGITRPPAESSSVTPMDIEWADGFGYATVAEGDILRLTVDGDRVESSVIASGLEAMRFPGRMEIWIDTKVQSQRTSPKPRTATPGKVLRLCFLDKAKDPAVEGSGALLLSCRHRQLHMVETEYFAGTIHDELLLSFFLSANFPDVVQPLRGIRLRTAAATARVTET